VADHPLKPATHRCLGRPLPYQLANGPRAHPEAEVANLFLTRPCGPVSLSGISSPFELLSRSSRQVTHVLLTRSPLSSYPHLPKQIWISGPLDLHVLSTPPAFVLSQDQTLQLSFYIFSCPMDRINIALLTSLSVSSSGIFPKRKRIF
jgi:hypothetical protein